ncbi:MAG: hypothetical protein ABR506_10100 [Candidatus Krumholzibacteriia bacterium]
MKIDRTFIVGGFAAALGLLLVVLVASGRGVAVGLPLDDAWIHAAFAKNLALDRTWGLLAGEHSGGESSLLWPLLLAGGELGGAGLAPLVALALGAVSFLALPGFVGLLASTPARGMVVAAAIGLCGPLLFAALSGMETMPALTCGAAALVFLRRGDLGRAAVGAGIAALLRPDALLLVPVLAAGAVTGAADPGKRPLPWRLRQWSRLWPLAAFALVVVTALSLLEQHFPPSTLAGRRWIVGLAREIRLTEAPAGLVAMGRQWADALLADLGAGHAAGGGPLAQAWRAVWAAAAVLAVGVALVATCRRSAARTHTALRHLVAWTLLTLLFYAVVLPDRGHAGRYQPQVYVCFVVLAVEGVFAAASRGRRTALVGLLAAAAIGAGLATSAVRTPGLWAVAVDHINRLHVAAAGQIRERTAPDDLVAVFDVGAIAYARPRRLLDISGLTGGEALDALCNRELPALLARRRADHVLLPLWGEPEGPGSLRDRLGLLSPDGLTIVPVYTWSYDGGGWWEQFRFSGNAFGHLRLYALTAPR